jgi:mannose-6-phosphate isomerase
MGLRRLKCKVQNYAWGKAAADSRVAALKCSEDSSYEVDDESKYAELWLGTHPNGPSRVFPEEDMGETGRGMYLIELLEKYTHFLGDLEKEGDLPFMFKVLSIERALSIQAHPDKVLAERLYATRPDLYRDDNHKPEMAVALSDFEGLCGFRPFHEIVFSLCRYPELRGMVSMAAVKAVMDVPEGVEERRNALRKLFCSYITARPNVVSTQIRALVDRLKLLQQSRRDANSCKEESLSMMSTDHCISSESLSPRSVSTAEDAHFTDREEFDMEDLEDLEALCSAAMPPNVDSEKVVREMLAKDLQVQELMLRLSEEYPADIGIPMPLLLNYLVMKPGDSFFMEANSPHAYLKGDILEVMARSDNVVRVALTHKYRDVPLLCEMLTYEMGPPPLVIPVTVDGFRKRYTPPIEDFELESVRVPPGESYSPPLLTVPGLMLALHGKGEVTDGLRTQRLQPGAACFVAAHITITYTADADCELVLAVAHTNIHWVRPDGVSGT